MKYYEVAFTMTPCSQDARDILSALAGEAGFETFEETESGLTGYVQQQLLDKPCLDSLLANFPFPDVHISYEIEEAEDRDWNEQWEQEGFSPIAIGNRLVIHDGRHLPEETAADPSQTARQDAPIAIEIDAHLAFGTGTHETTRMICATLLEMDLKGKRVLDCGCGTGILGICALKLGASHCTGYDIDEWSVENTRHNSVINLVDAQLTPLHGDASLLDTMNERFDVVMANINRNILLQDLSHFVRVMAPQGTLMLSGFYQSDCDMLTKQAQALGLTLKDRKEDEEWACLVFQA